MVRICEHVGLSHSKKIFAAHGIDFVENHFIDDNKSQSFLYTLGKFEAIQIRKLNLFNDTMSSSFKFGG